jgi:UDP-N-acetylglucosamine/UDP-N-acetylgalactosamine 4-epimerase
MINNQSVHINGDGKIRLDFCHIDNAVQAKITTATEIKEEASSQDYNVAVGERTKLNQLYALLRQNLVLHYLICSSKIGLL